MPSIPLPQELIESIITELCDDKQALWACSLVRHSWSVPAQRTLFSTVVLAPSLFELPASQSTPLITRFHTVAATSPHLLQYVKVLEFDPTCDAIQYIFSASRVLQELRVVNFLGEMNKGEDTLHAMLALPSVRRLIIREGPRYPGQIVPLLARCPQLRSLTLSRVMISASNPSGITSIPKNQRIQLHALSVRRLMPEILADLADNVVDVTHLRSFSAEFYPYFYDQRRIQRSIPVVQDVLRSVEGTLEHLHLDVTLHDPLHQVILLSRLQSLWLHLPTAKVKSATPYAASEAALKWLVLSFETLEAISLEDITLQRLPMTQTCKELARRLDKHLCSLVNLREVAVLPCEAKGDNADAEPRYSSMQEFFPLLSARGILRQYTRTSSTFERVSMTN